MGLARETRGAAAMLLLVAALSGCGPALHAVDDGVYGALVPTAQQWAERGSIDIPGGFAALSADGVKHVTVRIAGKSVTFELDGQATVTRTVMERRNIQDGEGSGPFKAQTQALSLGDEPLVLGSLRIDSPVIWFSAGYSSTTLVAVKPWDPKERGPIAQCTSAEQQCLELPVGDASLANPIGAYADMNDPVAMDNPVASIRVTATYIVYTLDNGKEVRSSREGETIVGSCALDASAVWSVPAEVGVAFTDPVLVDTSCALPTGSAPSLTVMERAAIPVLAPLAPQSGGQWCEPGPGCLWFIDEAGGKD